MPSIPKFVPTAIACGMCYGTYGVILEKKLAGIDPLVVFIMSTTAAMPFALLLWGLRWGAAWYFGWETSHLALPPFKEYLATMTFVGLLILTADVLYYVSYYFGADAATMTSFISLAAVFSVIILVGYDVGQLLVIKKLMVTWNELRPMLTPNRFTIPMFACLGLTIVFFVLRYNDLQVPQAG